MMPITANKQKRQKRYREGAFVYLQNVMHNKNKKTE